MRLRNLIKPATIAHSQAMMRVNIDQVDLELVQGDMTHQTTNAIVNAANSRLLGDGGVDGAIHRAGGPSILAECQHIRGCPTGEMRITGDGNLMVIRSKPRPSYPVPISIVLHLHYSTAFAALPFSRSTQIPMVIRSMQLPRWR